MEVYKIFASHENSMVQKFSRGWMPTYTKNGMLYYSKNVAEKNLAKCNEFKDSNKNYSYMDFEIITYDMIEKG